MPKILVTPDAYTWLHKFMRLHDFKHMYQAVDQLIMNHQAWNKKIGENPTGVDG